MTNGFSRSQTCYDPYFLYHRELLGELARIAYETVRERMLATVDEPHARPGMVAVIQTFGSSLRWNPHIHAIVTRRVFLDNGSWHPIPYVDAHKAELVFRHKVLSVLQDHELIDPLEFLARVLIHIPEPNKHLVHFQGAYANRVRSTLRADADGAQDTGEEPSPQRRALRTRWAELIYRTTRSTFNLPAMRGSNEDPRLHY